MSNKDAFEREAKVIRDRNQTEMDLKLFLTHWGGYKEVKARHHKELQDLAEKHGVDFNLKRWKLNGHWM